jgi:hypothetical protein
LNLTLDEILQLSPDEASTKAAKGLVVPEKWQLLGANEIALWGECQGSGAKPYQVQIDKSGPAYKCSCPSRKFPCKHGLALLLLHLNHNNKFTTKEIPSWVNDWVNTRLEKTEKQLAKKEVAAAIPVDPAAKAKQELARDKRMLKGLDELELWLKDQIRQGLASIPSFQKFGEALAARMVDSQMPGLGARIRQWESMIVNNIAWPETILGEFGKLQLLIVGFRRIQELPETMQSDIRFALGVTIDKEFVIAHGEKITDEWLVLGQTNIEEEKLWVRRVWLYGKATKRKALLLDFSHGTRQFEPNFISGTCVKMQVSFYPGSRNLRALSIDSPQLVNSNFLPKLSLSESLMHLSDQLSLNPWQWPQPMMISNIVPTIQKETWVLVSDNGFQIPLKIDTKEAWKLLALSGGAPLNFFGEWQTDKLQPLSCWQEDLIWIEGN